MPAGGDDAAVVELRGVCKSYGISRGQVVTAADEVSLSIRAGSWVAVTGASGSGKSTLPFRTGFDKRARGRELLAAVGLAGREQSLPARMSGGEQQRVAIARALVNDPALLLADEPTGNLDSANAAGILRLVGELRARRPVTVIMATHDPQVAGSAERIIRLGDGAVTGDTGLTAARETICPAGQGG